VSLTLGILKSLYPWADLDMAGEGFAATCSDEEALKLVEDSAKVAGQVVDMLGVDMSLGLSVIAYVLCSPLCNYIIMNGLL
jgi:hypothetical protein